VTPISLGIFASANQSAAATSYESIATVSVGSGGATSAEFTSIPGTYTHLQIRCLTGSSNPGAGMKIEFNSDTSTANYRNHYLY